MAEEIFDTSNLQTLSNDIELIVTSERRDEILSKIGYSISPNGELIDNKTGEKVKAEDGKNINIKQDKKLSLISGSHLFVRDIAGYSQVLANKGVIKFTPKDKEEVGKDETWVGNGLL